MKTYILYFLLTFPLISLAQSSHNFDLLSRNLIHIDAYKLLKEERSEYCKKSESNVTFKINECFEPGDFYVTSRDRSSIFVSNIYDPLILDSILPAHYPYGGSIGIITNEGTLINSRFDSVHYYSDSGWAYYGHFSDTGDLIHCAGGNQTVFYMGGNLWHLNGSNQPQLIYEDINYTCADLVVDSLERAWVLTGAKWPISDTLRVIDSTGNQICAFPFEEPLETYNAYGMMMYQNDIWLGLGDNNDLYPEKLLQLKIINNVVVVGISLDFPDLSNLDLESCEVGMPQLNCSVTSSNESIQTDNLIRVFPNPSSDLINVSSDVILDKVDIINLTGNVLLEVFPDNKTIQINIEKFPSGIYFVRMQRGENVEIVKQIK